MDKDKLFKFCFGAGPSVFSERVIITPFIQLKYFKKECDIKSVFKGGLYSGFTGVRKGMEVTVIYCGVGDRLAGDAVLLLERSKAEEVIFIGSCGGLDDRGIGDFIICEDAFNGEGFSRYHDEDFTMERILGAGRSIPADPGYMGELARFLKKHRDLGMNFERGSIFTVGSFLAEQKQNLLYIKEKGFKGVEMELSAVYQAAKAAGIRSAGLVVVSDLPLEKGIGEINVSEKGTLAKKTAEIVQFSLEFSCR